MPDDGHHVSPLGERTDLGTPIGRQNLGANVLDVESAPDRLTGIARLAAQEHGLDARVEQSLNGRAGARPQAVLQSNQPDDSIAQADQQDAPALPFELRHPRVHDGYADLLFQHDRATTDDETLAARGRCRHAQPRMRRRVANVVGPDAPRFATACKLLRCGEGMHVDAVSVSCRRQR